MAVTLPQITPLSFPMIEIEEAWRLIREHTSPLPPREFRFTEALGLILCEDVVAPEDVPPFPASVVDGYALRAEDGQHPRRVLGEQTAGYVAELAVGPNEAVWITTGAPVPRGANAVVKVEDTETHNGHIVPKVVIQPGDNIRPVGHDIRKGDVVLPKGTQLGPAEIGILATVNALQVLAHPRPRVAVMSTGDEIREPGTALAPGQIRDSNRYTLMAAVTQLGGIPVDLGPVPDQEETLRAALARGIAEADMIISSGGVSMGSRDLLKPILADMGHIHFGRVRVKPGKPVTFATINGTPVFALPGNPVSALVSFYLYAALAMRILSGHPTWQHPQTQVKLAHSITREPGRVEFQRAKAWREGATIWARTTGPQASSRLLSMVGANVLLRLEAEWEHIPEGTEVEAIVLEPLGLEATP